MKNRKKFKGTESKYNTIKDNGNVCNGRGTNITKQEHRDRFEAPCIFPKWSPWLLYCVTLAIRVSYVRRKSNWWIYHPDEIFQAIEVGHSLVFGYGFRTYEFFLPPGNITTSIDEQEKVNGMFSMRSFLFPQFYANVFWILNCLRLSYSPYVVGRIAHVIVTSSLPVAIFKFTQMMYRNSDISWLAAILTAFSQHLSLMGTHTIVNSFISPFIFFSLSNILPVILPAIKMDSDEGSEARQINTVMTGTHHTSARETLVHTNGDVSQNVIPKNKQKMSNRSLIQRKFIKKLTNFLSSESCNILINGCVLGLICYIRIDTALLLTVVVLSFGIVTFQRDTFMTTASRFLLTGFGFSSGLLVGGISDKLQYGSWFISPIQWYRLNLRTNIPSVLFGMQGVDVYINELFLQGAFTMLFSLAVFISLLITLTTSSANVTSTDKRNTLTLLCACVIYFCCYACVGHKELRFLHNFVTMQLVVSAFSVYTVLCRVFVDQISHLHSKYIICIVTGAFICNSFLNFPSTSTDMDSVWTKKAMDSSDINVCMHFVSQQKDAEAVFIDGSIYQSAAFSILKHDVPILVLIHNEYHEYSPSNTSVHTNSRNRFINRFSNFIWATNYDYLAKYLLENLSYNYIVTRGIRQRSYEDLGYRMVYNFGAHIVMKRELDATTRKRAKTYAKTLTMGKNATILEYEASWLFTAGLYEKAVIRAERAAQIDDSRVRLYQLLGLSYVKLERYEKAMDIERRCFKRHGERICRTPQTRLVLHPEYNHLESVRAST